MTIAITPIDINNDTWGDALARINSLADAASNNMVTVGGDPSVGDAIINGSLTVNTGNIIDVNANTVTANSANLVSITSNAATIETVTANNANVVTFHANTFTADNFSANNIEILTANNLVAVTANSTTMNTSNAYANIASITSRLGVATSELRYLVTFGQPGANTTATFNDRIMGISGAGGAGYKLDDTANDIRAWLGTFGDNVVSLVTQTGHSLTLGANNAEIVRFTPEGLMGVGLVAPVVKLHVSDRIAAGSGSSNTRIMSDVSEPRALNIIDTQGGARIWRTAASGDVLVEYGLGTATAITSVERWATGVNANGYFIRSFVGSTGTDRINISKTGEVSIGTGANPANNVILELSSTTKAFLPPRMSTAQRDAITPANGMFIHNATLGVPQYYSGGWKNATFSGNYSDLSGTPTLGNSAALNVGTAANTVAAGNDTRITGAVQANGGSLTGGYAGASKNLGNLAGSLTLTYVGGNIQHGINNGATTINAPTAPGVYTLIVQIQNNATAGPVTLAGFTKIDGDAFTTTNTHNFLLHIVKVNSAVKVSVEALQ